MLFQSNFSCPKSRSAAADAGLIDLFLSQEPRSERKGIAEIMMFYIIYVRLSLTKSLQIAIYLINCD